MDRIKLAAQYLQDNDYEKALEHFIVYTEENPQDPAGYINIANIFAHLKQYERAWDFYLKAIEMDDSSAAAYYGLGNIYFNTGKYDQAELMYREANKSGLQDGDVYYMLGMTHVKRDSLLLALPFLQRASEIKQEPEILMQYGLTLAKTNYLNEAETVFQEILALNSRYTDALYNLAIINEKAGQQTTGCQLSGESYIYR